MCCADNFAPNVEVSVMDSGEDGSAAALSGNPPENKAKFKQKIRCPENLSQTLKDG